MIFKKGYSDKELNRILTSAEAGDTSLLPLIFGVFGNEVKKRKKAAAKALCAALDKATVKELETADMNMRQRTAAGYCADLRDISFDDFFTSDMSKDEKRAVCILASFSPNGYVRERATGELVNYENVATPLLFRCADHVGAVRRLACSLLPAALGSEDDGGVLSALAYAMKRKNGVRFDQPLIISLISRELDKRDGIREKGLDSPVIGIRRFFILREVRSGGDVTEIIKREKDNYTKRAAFYAAGDSAKSALVRVLLEDKYPYNRDAALRYSNDPETAVRMLTDKNAKVRETARGILHDLAPDFDIRGFYLKNLKTNACACILGLGELKNKDDCKITEPYLISGKADETKAAIISLCRLDPDKYAPSAVRFLDSELGGVSKAAYKVLLFLDNYDKDAVFRITAKTERPITKKYGVMLLSKGNKWQSLVYLLSLLGIDVELDRLCLLRLAEWNKGFNRSYAALTDDKKETIIKLTGEKKDYLGKENADMIMFSVNGQRR